MSLKTIKNIDKFSTIEEISALPDHPSRIDVRVYNDKISAYYAPKPEAKKLYVFFNGAVDLKKVQPAFQRWSWAEHFDGHCIFIYDPTIYSIEEANLCWYSGREKYNMHNVIRKFVSQIQDVLGFTNEQTIFYGSSGGGFASIAIGSQFKGSTSVAINPQIYIRNYSQRLVENYISKAFPNTSIDDFHSKFPDQSNAVHIVKKYNEQHKIVYFQNTLDESHYNKHMKIFADAFDIQYGGLSSDGTKKIVLYDHPNGHAGETVEHVPHILHEVHSIQTQQP